MNSLKFLQPRHFNHLSASALLKFSTFFSSFAPLISDSISVTVPMLRPTALICLHFFLADLLICPEFHAWRHLFPYRGLDIQCRKDRSLIGEEQWYQLFIFCKATGSLSERVYNFVEICFAHGMCVDCAARQKHKLAYPIRDLHNSSYHFFLHDNSLYLTYISLIAL